MPLAFDDQPITVKRVLSKTELFCVDWLIHKSKRHNPVINPALFSLIKQFEKTILKPLKTLLVTRN